MPVCLGDRVVAKGPYEGPLIRLQIGLEDVDDLKADILRGLAAADGLTGARGLTAGQNQQTARKALALMTKREPLAASHCSAARNIILPSR